MDHDDPLAPLGKLMQRLAEVMDELGLELQTFAVLPHPPDMDMPNMAQAVFVLDPEKVFLSPEQQAEKKLLADMDRRLHAERTHDKIAEAREAAIRSLAEQSGTTVEGLGLDIEHLPEIEVKDEITAEIETDGADEEDETSAPEVPAPVESVDVDHPEHASSVEEPAGIDAFDPSLSIEEIMRLMDENGKDDPPLAGV